MQKRKKVFLSYARSDGERFASDLYDRLRVEEPDIELWHDRHDMSGRWWTQIAEAIDDVKYLVLVATPNALQSPNVRDEWDYPHRNGVCICPIRPRPMPI